MLNVEPPNYNFCPLCGNKLNPEELESGSRKNCSRCGWSYYPKVAASSVAVIKNKGKVLMVKRARKPYKDTWMFPAGFVDYGEHPDEAVVREVEEETGLKVKDFKLWKIQQVEDDPREPGHFAFVYLTEAKGDIKNLDEKENKDIGWFNVKNPPKIGWKQHKEIMKEIQGGNIASISAD